MLNEVAFRLETTAADLEAEKETFTFKETEPIPPSPDMPPLADARFVELVAAVIVTSIALIAKRMVDHWLKSKEQGVQINLSKDPPVISRIAGVPMGFLVVIHRDGKVTTHQAKYECGEDLEPLLRLVLAGR
jgi:hypothetical protein